MKNKLIILLLVGTPILSNAQELRRNNVYFELAGASMFYSMNYERLWLDNDEYNITTRAGIMYIYLFNDEERTIAGVPIGASYLKKLKKYYFEIGVSFSVIRDTYHLDLGNSETLNIDELVLMPSIRAGLRHQPTDKRLFWNILAQVSLMAHGETQQYQPYIRVFPLISFGIGYSF